MSHFQFLYYDGINSIIFPCAMSMNRPARVYNKVHLSRMNFSVKARLKKNHQTFSIKFCSKLGYIIIQNKLKGSIVYIQIKMIISISKIF